MSDRLSVIDEMFLRTHRGFGTPIVMQGLWRCDDEIDRVDLDVLHSNLSVGRLSKRVVSPKVPLARRYWTTSTESLPFEYARSPLAADGLIEWADAQTDIGLDPEFGPGWRLTAASTHDGGTVVSLVCSHAIADAQGLAAAISQALSGAAATRAPRHHASTSVAADVIDAAKLTATVTVGTTRAVARLAVSRKRRRDLRSFMNKPSTVGPEAVGNWTAPSVVAQINTAEWDTAASALGGSANSLYIAVVSGVARRLGFDEPQVSVGVPFATRTSGANAIAMGEITVRADDSLQDIRQLCVEAFTHPVTGPADFPEQILQIVPDSVAHRLASSPGECDVLCSNIGALPRQLEWIGPHRCTGLATRAVHPNLAADKTGGRWLSAYLSRFDDMYTLSLTGLRPSANQNSGPAARFHHRRAQRQAPHHAILVGLA